MNSPWLNTDTPISITRNHGQLRKTNNTILTEAINPNQNLFQDINTAK